MCHFWYHLSVPSLVWVCAFEKWIPMCYPWQNGLCKDYTPKVTSGNKMICGLGQLPITLMSMIAHGHGNERYAQYSIELWPNDPKFTIESLLRLFWTLEKTLIYEPKILFEHPPQNVFFACLLQGNFMYKWIKNNKWNCWPKIIVEKFVVSNG